MEELLTDIVILFGLSIISVIVCNRLHLPSIVGFLLTGVLAGPSALGFTHNKEVIDLMAEVGVAFLMFSIGMELSGKELVKMRKPLLLGGSAQVLLTTGLSFLLSFWWAGPRLGIVYGFMITLSSTAIVLSLLQGKGQTDSPQGRVVLAILIFQDLAIVPMVLLLPLLAGGIELDPESMLLAAGKGLLVICGIMVFSKLLLPRLMFCVVGTKSRELMLMAVIGLCLSVALVTSWIGLSLSLGAFLAGLMMAESEYSLNTLESMLPFKEVFSSIFFISVGMLLDVGFFASHILAVTASAALIITVKILASMPLARILGYSLRTSVLTAFCLAQVGEFSFVLAKSAMDLKLLDNDAYQIFLASSILTMVLTPFLMNLAPKAASKLARRPEAQDSPELTAEAGEDAEEDGNGIIRDGRKLKDHLIIIGFGIGGQLMARGARKCGIPYIISEMNPDTVYKFRSTEPIRHGDASFKSVLEHLGAATARTLVILITDPAGGRAIVANARALNPKLNIIVRTRFLSNLESYRKLGANDVIPEEFETSLEVFARVLNHYLVPRQTIDRYVATLRRENYEMDRRLDIGGSIMESIPDLQISACTVEKDSPLDGRTIAEAALRKEHRITAAGIRRAGSVDSTPGAQTRLLAGDVVYVLSTEEALASAMHLFHAPEGGAPAAGGASA